MTDNDKIRKALEDIALLDEADGHELTVRHAHEAVAIATTALGKHPSEICADRHRAHTTFVGSACNRNQNQHHYIMPSGQCSCQDQSWAR